MKKAIIFITLSFLLFVPLYAISFTYFDTPQSYDSDVLLSSFEQNKDFLTQTEEEIKDIVIVFYGPGSSVHEYYGHVGIIIRYKNGEETLYDYGVFNPNEKGFVKNVIQGKMFYALSSGNTVKFLENYMRDVSRSVKYYRLINISDEKKKQIESFLKFNAGEDRNKYLYNFFTDNCSTRVRDILNVAYDGALEEFGQREFGTRREAISPQTTPHVMVETVFGIAEGAIQDRTISYYEAMFLPSVLEYSLRSITVINDLGEKEHIVALEGESIWHNKYDYNVSESKGASSYTILMLIIIQIVLLNIVLKILYTTKIERFAKKMFSFINGLILLFMFVLSLAMSYMCLYTIFDCAWKNQNLIFINPLLIFPVVFAFKGLFAISYDKEKKALRNLSISSLLFFGLTIIALVLKFIILPYQANLVHILYFMLYYLSLPDYAQLYKGRSK